MSLKGIQPDLKEAQPDLKGTKSDLNVTQPNLKETQMGLKETQPDLKVTQMDLKETQPDLKVTQMDSNGTQTDLKETQPDLKGTQMDSKVTLSVSKETTSTLKEVKSKSLFWPIQFSVWLMIGLVNFTFQHFNSKIPADIKALNFIGIGAGGFVITSLYRYYLQIRKYNFKMGAGKFILSLLLSALLQSICWVILIALLFYKYHLGFWQSAGALIPFLGMILIWNMVYLSYKLIRQYHTTEVEKWKLEAEVQKARLGALKSQINPHFMFNALNNIRSLILEDPALARGMLTKFSEIFRHALQHSEEKEIILSEELEILQQYFDLLKIQYENKLQYQINADQTVFKEKIPPMILQLLVENAVKHGIGLSPDGGKITVDISKTKDQLVLTVKNTGTLIFKNKLEDSLGIGLKNITERLKLLYDNQASLAMYEEAPDVIVTINIKKS